MKIVSEEDEIKRLAVLSAYEEKYYELGYHYIAGADECGRGCLAGPVAAAAVILPRGVIIKGINDSKKLSPGRREALCAEILEKALAVRFETAGADVIDSINILRASLTAMGKALNGLNIKPQAALIDGRFLPDIELRMEPIIGGDGKSVSIAAASIVAKVLRDALMSRYDASYPGYGFIRNKGYGTKEHYDALSRLGPCPIHRMSFNLQGACYENSHRNKPTHK
ncbi:MAG: ribonuclease HII [Clostridiales bacterium]|jgi:ribonuclease HII|nr:ribonuclease HII [Clostridiales bacterium]